MIYKAEEYTFQTPTVDPTTPHDQAPWLQAIQAVQERQLTRDFGLTINQATSQIAMQASQMQRVEVHAVGVQEAMFAGAHPLPPLGG